MSSPSRAPARLDAPSSSADIRRRRPERAAAYALLTIAALAIVLACWPGLLDSDSIATLREVRSGAIGDQRSTVLTWLWRQAYRVVSLGPGPVLLAQVAALAAGLYLVRSCFGRFAAAVVATLLLFAPPTFGFVGLVGRDAWFASSCLLCAGLSIGVFRWDGRARTAALVGAVVAAVIAVAARQNGFMTVLPLLLGVAGPAARSIAGGRGVGRLAVRRPVGFAVGSGLIACFALLALTTGATSIMRDRTDHPQMYTELYDLGYLTVDQDQRLIHGVRRAAQPVQTPAQMEGRWLPTTSIYMHWDPAENFALDSAPEPYTDADVTGLDESWRDAVLAHPLDYLEGRLGLWKRQLGIDHSPWYSIVVESQPNAFGYDGPAFPGLSRLANRYATHWVAYPGSLTGGPVHHVWIYLLACLLSLGLLLPRFSGPVRMVGALAAGAVAMQLGLFFLAPSVQLRYQLLTIYVGLLGICVGARVAVAALARYRAGPTA